jgi:hypothetical protein
LFYDNGGDALICTSGGQIVIKNNVFFANDSDGIYISSATNCSPIHVVNNIFRSNGGYGINMNSIDTDLIGYCDYNCYSNNSSGAIDIFGGTPPGSNNVTSDPKFVSETDGSEDFNLQSDSPCKNAGYGYNG